MCGIRASCFFCIAYCLQYLPDAPFPVEGEGLRITVFRIRHVPTEAENIAYNGSVNLMSTDVQK